ncbi:hypothetical protein J3A83DRAFT_4212230 [Scleroderma citrinum]
MNGSSTHNNVLNLLVLRVVFHIVFTTSVFDCHFTSPVIQGMPRLHSRSISRPSCCSFPACCFS